MSFRGIQKDLGSIATSKLAAYIFLAAIVVFPCVGRADEPTNLRILPTSDKPRFTLTDRDWPKEVGQASVCLWRDDKLAAATITIDDNMVQDHAWWLAAGEKHGFKFTWFVISARVTGSHPVFGKWEDFQKLHAAGHDVQSHTVTHFNPDVKREQGTESIYKDAISDIETNVPGTKVLTLAYPGGPNAKNDPALASKYYVACRGTRGHLNTANNIDYVQTASVGNGFPTEGGNWAAAPRMLNPKDKLFRGWGCVHFHGLENPKEPEKSAKINAEKMLNYLSEHKYDFWVGTFTDVTLYGQERDTAKLESKVQGDSIQLTLTDRMDDSLFDRPLTAKVRIDPGWSKVSAKQGEKQLDVPVIEKDGGKFAFVPVIPDRGPVTVSKGE